MNTFGFVYRLGLFGFGIVYSGWLSAAMMTEGELNQLYLDVVETAVSVYEPLWTDDSARIPNSGFFDFRQYKNWMDEPYATIIIIPGNGMVAFCYSVLLTETDKEFFTSDRIPRSTLLEHAIKALRWCCLTSAYVEKPYPYLPNTRPEFLDGLHWRRQFGYRADEVGWLTMAAAKLWNQLDNETKKLLEAVMIGGAPKERLVRSWYVPQGGNQDQVKQDLSSTMGAAFLFPKHPDHTKYLDAVRGNGIDMVSTLQDMACGTIADGAPVREWSKGWNLYPDYSSDHHGWCNIWYGNEKLYEGRLYVQILSALTGIPVPETYTYAGNGFDGILEWIKVLCLSEGEPASPHGNEYDAYYGAGVLAFAYGAVLKKDPLAAALEERAAQLLQRHSGAIRMYDYHRNSWAKAATALLLHKIAGPRAEPIPFAEATRRLEGTYHYRWLRNLIHRSPDKWASFAWGSISSHRNVSEQYGDGLCGFVIPMQTEKERPEPFVYCHPKSLIGDVAALDENGKPPKDAAPESLYRFDRNDRELHTAGVVSNSLLDRYYAFFSFQDGPCVFFSLFRAKATCRLRWSGLPIYFYVRPGLTGSRRFYSDGETHPLEEKAKHESVWWCVEDRLGMVTVGGNRQVNLERSVGYNWARQPEYKDKCDGVFVSSLPEKNLKAGEIGMDLSTLIYANTAHENLSKLAEAEKDWAIQLPEGWRGLLAPDGTRSGKRFLSIVNFWGNELQASVVLTAPEGVPALSLPTTIMGKQGTLSLHLQNWESYAEPCDLYVESLQRSRVEIQKESSSKYRLKPLDNEKASVQIRYFGKKPVTLYVRDAEGKRINEVAYTPNQGLLEFSVHLAETTFIGIQSQEPSDHIGPAVEISNIEVREDGRTAIEVIADDQSGIQSVQLYCDDRLISQKQNKPFHWVHRPGPGAHTFYTMAEDASPNHNQRFSFKRTITIPQ